ncbi:hypothetical protein BU23DRAFT_591938 [Bimuria novae-zelandiae CBS 107.79]|uniref:Uncharacterized protein n=1 Tax=Bimuria novae-zelandiae CBS 107.79 TaxID=1447943 RepID=A0A6A5UWQ2_9PLEO|nr:hypothetical protein BU23DRAFT_591938 [Bimuria novae-zelandiae CBS 107.79]
MKRGSVEEWIKASEMRGFGHAFEKSYTREVVAASTGHHRVVGVRFETDGKAEEKVEGSKLLVRKEGQTVPLEATLEVKTRVRHRPLGFEDVVSQLWVSQTPKLVRAYYTRGVFEVPEVEEVADKVKRWEEQNQKDLRMLAALVGKIRDVVKEKGGRATVKYESGADKLVFLKLDGKKMLPESLYAKWEGSEH